jgi:hypothetical protein
MPHAVTARHFQWLHAMEMPHAVMGCRPRIFSEIFLKKMAAEQSPFNDSGFSCRPSQIELCIAAATAFLNDAMRH